MTQNQAIMKVLSKGKKLSVAQAVSQYGIKNLRARVSELRHSGTNIVTGKNKAGNTTYSLVAQ